MDSMSSDSTNNHALDADGEVECRVCRLGGDDDRPLYTPCLCSGSIGLVHQDCLEAWLAHSKKDTCELCSTKYQFEPLYRPDTPAVMPMGIMFKSFSSILIQKIFPLSFRVILAIIIWLFLVPIGATIAYCTCLRREFPTSQNFPLRFSTAVCYGIVIDCVMALSLLIILSFADFLRFHLAPVGNAGRPIPNNLNNNNNNANNNNINNNGAAGVAINQNNNNNNNIHIDNNIRNILHNGIPPENHPNLPPVPPENAPPRLPLDEATHKEDTDDSEDDDTLNNDIDEAEKELANLLNRNDDDHAEDEDDEDLIFQQEQAALNNEINNAIEQLQMEMDGGLGGAQGGAGGGGGEDNQVQIAIMDILGIEGPFYIVFRNAAWLVAFSSVYLTLLGFFPYVIGSMVIRFLRLKFDAYFPNAMEELTLKLLLNKIERLSTELNPPLQFMDFILMATGYVTIMTMIFGVDLLLSQIRRIKGLESIRVVADPLTSLTTMVKVGVLLITRILLLPITFGSGMVMLMAKELFPMYTLDMWALFIVKNSVGMYGICWFAGISFMLSMTLSVLQLREVMHPDIFAKWIKPQETHSDLIASLMTESGLVHAKRFLMSFFVYALLLQVTVSTPLQILKWAQSFGVFPADFFQLQTWYFLPELQIPCELVVGHITFLSILDAKKNVIGRLQHKWMVWIAHQLDMTRFILPLPMLKRRKRRTPKKSQKISRKRRNDGTMHNHDALVRTQDIQEEEQKQPTVEETQAIEEIIEVGPPMVRPLPGWDHRTSSNKAARWAWRDETPSAIERHVAPRVTPPNWLWKTLLLIVVSWLLLVAMTLVLIVIPLTIGRGITKSLYVPVVLRHDPLHFLMGMGVLLYLYEALEPLPRALYHVTRKLPYLWRHVLTWKLMVHSTWVAGKRLLTYALVGITLRFLSVHGAFVTISHLWSTSHWSLSSLQHYATWLQLSDAQLLSLLKIDNPLQSFPMIPCTYMDVCWDIFSGMLFLEGLLVCLLRSGIANWLIRHVKDNAVSSWVLCYSCVLERVSQDLAVLWDASEHTYPSQTHISDCLMLWDTVIVTPTLKRVSMDVVSLAGMVFLRQWAIWQASYYFLRHANLDPNALANFAEDITGSADMDTESSSDSPMEAAGHFKSTVKLAQTWQANNRAMWIMLQAFGQVPIWGMLWLWTVSWSVTQVLIWFHLPLQRAWQSMYDTIRDQHYLIGKRLKNAVRESAPTDANAAPNTNISAATVG